TSARWPRSWWTTTSSPRWSAPSPRRSRPSSKPGCRRVSGVWCPASICRIFDARHPTLSSPDVLMNRGPVSFSAFARNLTSEPAFDVLAVARRLKAQGKDVIELQIGDSPFPSTRHALEAGTQAIRDGHTHYCPSLGLPSFREAVAQNYFREYGVGITADNVVVGAGAKCFEQFFCEAVLDPGDAVLVFRPYLPTYGPNIERRGARAVYVPLKQEHAFRPDLNAVKDFLDKTPRAKAIFLNSPHNPTGGVATPEDLRGLAELVRGRDVA